MVFEKNEVEWTGKVENRTKFVAVSDVCMAAFWPIPGFKGRPFGARASQQRGLKFLRPQYPTAGYGLGISARLYMVLTTNNMENFQLHHHSSRTSF